MGLLPPSTTLVDLLFSLFMICYGTCRLMEAKRIDCLHRPELAPLPFRGVTDAVHRHGAKGQRMFLFVASREGRVCTCTRIR
ncbi:hypothetical protein B0T26DRAFT_722597 [Lasiosphaeria miniovina]|uniref:Secreted protein n=1 Tax=Lasiosphaeria miniovina TaxID=1954250 RepID=A0AA40DN02_9PEZI|nr:uncharacterized protein B0T26DRAFT_722597 [Lasiosphaeria miniovina]KAK0709699.1 hypothetical protein B0T26DRAFT_722597 [Lasiosphaeria miniovina]